MDNAFPWYFNVGFALFLFSSGLFMLLCCIGLGTAACDAVIAYYRNRRLKDAKDAKEVKRG